MRLYEVGRRVLLFRIRRLALQPGYCFFKFFRKRMEITVLADRGKDFSAAVLSVVAVVSVALILLLGNNGAIITYGYLIAELVFVLPVYWSLSIRHALAVGLYRRQALGLVLISIVIGLSSLPILPSTGTAAIVLSAAGLLTLVIDIGFMLGLLYFIDATMLASRRSDPLLRDTAHWSKVRIVVWAWEFFNVAFIIAVFAYMAVTGDVSISSQIVNYGNFTYIPSLIYNLAWFVPVFGSVVILPAAVRARDPRFRKHLEWLALLVVVGILLVIASSLTSATQYLLVVLIGNVALAYLIYRSATALVPINRIGALDEVSKSNP
jgi:hypothetical protein